MYILHPVKIGLSEAFGDELNAPVFNNLNRLFGQGLHLDKPLRGEHRLNGLAATIAATDIVIISLGFDKIPLLFKLGHYRLARFVSVHAVKLAAVYDFAVLVNALDLLQVMTKPDFVVIGVMAGGHLDSARAEAQLYIIIRDYRELAPDKGQHRIFADKMLILFILGVHGNAAVAEHGFGASRGDYKLLIGVFHRVADIPKRAGNVLIFNLGIGKRRAAIGTPVNHSAAFVDKAFIIKLAERFAHGLCANLVHGEAAAIPVTANAHALLLLDYSVTVLLFPRPNALQKLVAPEVIAGFALGLAQNLFNLYLRGYARMVNARQPQRGIPLHTLIAREDILQGGVHRVPHVQLPRNIGGRHDNGKRFFVGVNFAFEIPAVHPHIVDFLLDRFRVIHFGKLFHCFLS